jgi:uncharacterized protein YggT (Ycf19 family)
MATLRRRRAATTRDGETVERGRGAGVAAGARTGLSLLARVVSLITAIVVGIIVIGIVLVLLKANPTNQIVSFFHDTAKTLVGPFKDVFSIKGRKGIAVNWGLAAVVYAIVGGFIVRLLSR